MRYPLTGERVASPFPECNQANDRSRIEGEWRKYDQGSVPAILERDLQGKGTGWCTATGRAPQQLKDGDFHVYYTDDLRVAVGQLVDRETVLGLVGSSGRSTGPHLHFEVRVAGTPVDPSWVF